MAKDPEDMTNEELLESIAALDEEKFPGAPWAESALERGREEDG